MSAAEFERVPVTPEKLQPARHVAASYASEHVAGTEFVIGAGMAVMAYTGQLSLNHFRAYLIWPSLVYFVSATAWVIKREKAD